ncbi:glycosyltransferase family 4 protein [Polaribacter sargassicola]|uniref:glycosyltransferase family 4 protein n=1 Tax=Polaribacter sargassicola TaxID=2836891 RepID=UPI001F2F4C46|nr:glycosyltransferase family 4 protein [Polaribacter sp. DS7-9]MCG1037473.1 glycosyltransferase family 4 protein [Polaribacter sp. DS7-9]
MKLLIVYHYIAHYRLPIFKELKTSKKIDVNIAAGIDTEANIKVVQPDELGYEVLKNKWLFNKKILWQSGLLKLIFRRYDYYIFLGNPYFLSTWFSMILCKIMGKKTSIWAHGVTFDLSKGKKIILKTFWSFCDKIYVYGHYAKNKMISYGVNAEKIIVIYNSLDYKNQIKIRNNFVKSNLYTDYFKNSDPVLIFTGRLTKIKKLHQILEAMKILKDKNIFCNLIFIGDGEERERLEKLVQELSLGNRVWFYGACYDDDLIGDFFMNANVCVAPGNVGLTAMHSLVFGVPIITHSSFEAQMPEFEAIEDKVTGSFFEKDNVRDLAEKIKYWLLMDKEQIKKHREECFKVIDEKYNPVTQRQILEKSLQ